MTFVLFVVGIVFQCTNPCFTCFIMARPHFRNLESKDCMMYPSSETIPARRSSSSFKLLYSAGWTDMASVLAVSVSESIVCGENLLELSECDDTFSLKRTMPR